MLTIYSLCRNYIHCQHDNLKVVRYARAQSSVNKFKNRGDTLWHALAWLVSAEKKY
jgi:hypothetical protein